MRATTDVSAAITATLSEHLPAWLSAKGLTLPARYDEVPDRELIRRVKGAVLAVSVPGTAEAMTRRSDGLWDATYGAVVTVLHETGTGSLFPSATGLYAACVRTVLKQHPSLGGFAAGVDDFTERIDVAGDAQSSGVIGLAFVEFTVDVPGVSDESEVPTGLTGPLVLTTSIPVNVTL